MRGLQGTIGLILAIASAGCDGSPTARRTARPKDVPTVVVISVDTLRADRVGAYGQPAAGTPVIDRLAEGGMLFLRAQTTAPLTLPAHSSLLTGRTLPAHGVFNNLTYSLPASIPTLAEQLRAVGFATAAFVSAPVLATRYGLARGFDEYDDRIPRKPAAGGGPPPHPERPGAVTVDAALAFLDRIGDRPAFLWVHVYEPHRPYAPPAEFLARANGDRYQGEVMAADAAIGRLELGLAARGRGEKALWIVTADHGEGLGDHGEATHGIHLYASTMHVPLVINGPKFGVVAGRNDEPVCIADVSPTILELLGAAPLADIDGVSLAPLAKGGAGALPRQGVLAESHIPRLEYGWSGLRAWVRRDAKLIQAPRPEYFATADRGEASNLATQQPAAVSQALDELRGAVAAAEALGAGSAEQSASAEQQDLMRSLGYVSAGGRARDGDLVDARRTDPKDRREFEDLFDRAVLATQAGRIPEALELFDRLGRLEVDNPAVLFEHGQALIRAGQLPRAITIYERLLAVEPTSGPGWFRYGQLLDNTRRWEDAEAAYRKATSVDPNNVDAHKALGSLLIDRERIPEAIEVLERALALDPTDPAIRRDLEQLWQRTRR